MTKTQNLQDTFLNQARKKNVPLTVFLVNGFQMRGTVTGFDSFTIVLESEGKQQLIYKHAVSTVAPMRRIDFSMPEESGSDIDGSREAVCLP